MRESMSDKLKGAVKVKAHFGVLWEEAEKFVKADHWPHSRLALCDARAYMLRPERW